MQPTLILVDIQQGFNDPYWGRRNNPDFERNAASLLRAWRENGGEIVHVRHRSTEPGSPLRPGQPGCDFLLWAQPRAGEHVFEKKVHSAFIGTELLAYLRERGTREVVLAGLTSDHCVSTTARMACDYGFAVTVASDATATFDRVDDEGKKIPAARVHRVSLASLNQEFARILTTSCLLSEVDHARAR